MKASSRPVVLMRPGAANNRLAILLEEEGLDVWRWPAYWIALPEDEESVAERLARLDDVEMVILPSPSAVTAVAHWVRRWPRHITVATVGEGTARVVRAAWGDDVRVICPPGDPAHSGSEALFDLMRKTKVPSRVLIARGQTGREWLGERLNELGADVEKLCTYVRVPLELSKEDITRLSSAVAGLPPPVVYITSTDAVAVLLHAVKPVEGAAEWFQAGSAITIHPRCAAKLREAGFADIAISSPEDGDVRDRIRKFTS